MDDLVSRKRFAAELGVPVRTLDRWARRGCWGALLPQRLRGGRVFYARADYEAWQRDVAARRAAPKPDPRPEPARERRRRQKRALEACRRMGMKV